ncbi:MAG TPA: hypothetical protein VHO72_14310 [Bacteroidales bacterium]|nr:hypothetical protein [Bacteroidales bacterium]
MIQIRYNILIFCLIMCIVSSVSGQIYTSKAIPSGNNNAFISSGQDLTFYLKENTPIKINTIFYPQLTYKVEIITENPAYDIEMKLFSPDGKKYFTNSDKNYIKFWHFCFQSISSSIIELRARNKNIKEQQVQIKISYLQL